MDQNNGSQLPNNNVSEPVAPVPPTAPAPPPASPSVIGPSFSPPGGAVPATNPAPAATSGSFTGNKSKKFRKLAIIIGVALLFVGGGAFGYVGVYKQLPSVVWADAMQKTAAGIKEFTAAERFDSDAYEFSGTLAVTKPIVGDVTFKGISGKTSGSIEVSAGLSGVGIEIESRIIDVEISEYPDVYLKAKGLGSLQPFIGSAFDLSQIENQWLFVDHTLLNQVAQIGAASPEEDQALTEAEIEEIRVKLLEVMSDYVFTTDDSMSIVDRTESSNSEFDAHACVKYTVVPDKQNLKAFVTALKDAIKDTKLGTALQGQYSSIEEALEFEKLLEDIDKINTDEITIEVWVDKANRYVRNVRFTPKLNEGETAQLDIGLNYDGGDKFPFYIRLNGEDENSSGTADFTLTINQADKSYDVEASFMTDAKTDAEIDTEGRFTMSIKPTTENSKPEKPEGAINVMELLGGLMGSPVLGDDTDGGLAPSGGFIDSLPNLLTF